MTSPPESTITASHWGTYRVLSSNGRVVGVQPFEDDPEPSPMIEATGCSTCAMPRASTDDSERLA